MSVGIADGFSSFENKAIIKVCGIGGGGGNAVGRMIEAGLKDVEFIAINTDAQALRDSPAGTRLQIGSDGLGAGAKPDVGYRAADEDRDRIAEVLRGADMIFLTAGLGGGTGTGAMPIAAEVAKESGALTVAIVTLPFEFEGGDRMKNAQAGLERLQEHVDAAIVVPNDRLSILCQNNISFLNAFRLADEVLHNGVRSISDLITMTGLINLDFADVRTVMESSGRALMGIGTAEGENRAQRAAQEAIVCPLLENSSIDGAMGVIVNVQGGADIGMREVHTAVTTVQKAAHPDANIIFGAVVDESERPELKVTVIAAGFPRRTNWSSARNPEAAATPNPSSEPSPAGGHLSSEPGQAPPAAPAEKGRPSQRAAVPGSDTERGEERGAGMPVQTLIPEDDQDVVDASTETGHNKDEEDLGIPAFMRRRMEKS